MQKYNQEIILHQNFEDYGDGIRRAEILIDNYLWTREPGKFKAILEKYGLKEHANWMRYDGDFDAIRIFVRPEDIGLMEEMITEIQILSHNLQEESEKESVRRAEALKEPQEKLRKVIADLQNIDTIPPVPSEDPGIETEVEP